MKKRNKDIEGIADTIGIDLNSHMSFGASNPPIPLTPIITQQSSPEHIIDNIEKRV